MIAIYRCLYGADFIKDSIQSIADYVDRIFIFADSTPWGNVTHVEYKGEIVSIPPIIDYVLDEILSLVREGYPINLLFDHVYTPVNQFTHLVNDIVIPYYGKPQQIMFVEVDQVFRKDQIEQALYEFGNSEYKYASTRQVEIWKGFQHRVPERKRTGVMFWDLSDMDKMPNTLHQANLHVMLYLDAYVHNFGFAMNVQTMYWKHLIALGYAGKIRDSRPNPEWYDKKWLTWDYQTNNENLEISLGREYLIPYVEPYGIHGLPSSIQERVNA